MRVPSLATTDASALRALLVARQGATSPTRAPTEAAASTVVALQRSDYSDQARSLIAASSRRIESGALFETRKTAVVSSGPRVREKHLVDTEVEVVALSNGIRWALRGPAPPPTSEMLVGGALHDNVNTLLAFLSGPPATFCRKEA